MIARDRTSRPPVVLVAGGAGSMGSLLVEQLLPSLDTCLIVDRFARGDDAEPAPAPLSPLAERFADGLQREGLESMLVVVNQPSPGHAVLTLGRAVRAVPAWLLGRDPAGPWRPPEADALLTGPAGAVRHLAALPGVRKVVVFAGPDQAMDCAALADILLVATPFTDDEQFAALLAPYAAGLRPGSLVCDLLSIKEAPLRVLRRVFPESVGILGMHPLFGRTAGDVTGLVVAIVPSTDGRRTVAWQSWLLRQLAGLGLLLTPTLAAEHDDAMSFVQAMSHFALLCFAYTFVRANQDPTQLLPFRTPVFEPLLYLAARVASLAQRGPDVYRAIQAESTRPELRRLFVETAQELLAAIESGERDRVTTLFQALGAPWTPAYHRDAEPYEQLIAMSNTLTEPINALRYRLLQHAGQIVAIRNLRSASVTLGAVYVDPLHHDRVDLASRLRYQRFNPTTGALEGEHEGAGSESGGEGAHRRIEASLGSLPLAQVEILTEEAMRSWLGETMGPRSGPDDFRGEPATPAPGQRGPRARYIGKSHYDLSLALPSWLDDDCLQRLLLGRQFGQAHVVAVSVTPQDAPGMVAGDGLIAVIVRLALLVDPGVIRGLRAQAGQMLRREGEPTDRSERHRRYDQHLAALATGHQLGAREAVLDWLYAHGGAALRRQESDAMGSSAGADRLP